MCNTKPSNTPEGRRQSRASGTVFLTQNEEIDGTSTPGDVEVHAYLRSINTRRRDADMQLALRLVFGSVDERSCMPDPNLSESLIEDAAGQPELPEFYDSSVTQPSRRRRNKF